jgi:hypothetical protein
MILSPYALDLTSLKMGTSSGSRAPGLHASHIYGDFYKDFDPKRYGRDGGPDPYTLEAGLLIESMLEEGLKRRIEEEHAVDISRPGEFTHEFDWNGKQGQIHYNPDLFIFNGQFRVGEIKATWMTSGVSHEQIDAASKGDSVALEACQNVLLEPKFAKYLSQLKFYLYFLNNRFGRLYVFFFQANRRPPFPPQFLAWDIEFSQDELDFEYHVLMNHADSKGMLEHDYCILHP